MQFGNSCHVVKAVLLAKLIKFGAQIDFNFLFLVNFVIDYEWFLSGFLVGDLLLHLLKICHQAPD